jgi:hypothetical protein
MVTKLECYEWFHENVTKFGEYPYDIRSAEGEDEVIVTFTIELPSKFYNSTRFREVFTEVIAVEIAMSGYEEKVYDRDKAFNVYEEIYFRNTGKKLPNRTKKLFFKVMEQVDVQG